MVMLTLTSTPIGKIYKMAIDSLYERAERRSILLISWRAVEIYGKPYEIR